MQGKECVCVCMYVCVPMEEHETWTMRHSCNLPRGRTGRFKESCIEILFFFSFGLGSRDGPTDRPFRFILDYEFVIFIARPGTCDRRGVGYLGFRCDAKRVNI